MARIVAGFGVPHNPGSPEEIRTGRADPTLSAHYEAVAEQVDKAELDALVVFSADHLNTFFLDNLPLFSVGITDRTSGPNDDTVMPRYSVPVHESLGSHIRASGLGEDFDLGVTQEFELDHSFLVPLHFLTPRMQVPIVPVFIGGIVAPLPRARRCLELGQAVRRAIEAWPENSRVGVLGSGSFSLDIGGTGGAPDTFNGIPDMEWSRTVVELMGNATHQELVERATAAQIAKAGNVAGELLNWIAALGALGDERPMILEPQRNRGEAFAAWRLD